MVVFGNGRLQKRCIVLPPFPQDPRTLTVRQLECARCREIFTIAEDSPNRFSRRTTSWQVPQDQYSLTPLRYVEDRKQIGVMPEVRSQPIERVSANQDWGQNYHLNCPRCGADNRNWLFISSRIRPLLAHFVIIGGILSLILTVFILVSRWSDVFQGRPLAMICLALAAALPLLIIPGQWRALRDHQLARRFLPNLAQPQMAPTVRTAAILFVVLILVIPGLRYGFVPVMRQALSATVGLISDAETNSSDKSIAEIADDLDFLPDWLYLGTLTSIVSSAFALLGVSQVLGRVNNQLPRPIYTNTANMVRVTLWEAKRALEIKDFFENIQWTLTKRNEQGGIDMEGYFRDPPEFLANGELADLVRVQKYEISTDRWCVITSAKIVDTKHPRPAGGMYSLPLPHETATPEVLISRIKY